MLAETGRKNGVKNRCGPTGFRERHPPVRPHTEWAKGEAQYKNTAPSCFSPLLLFLVIVACIASLMLPEETKQILCRIQEQNKNRMLQK